MKKFWLLSFVGCFLTLCGAEINLSASAFSQLDGWDMTGDFLCSMRKSATAQATIKVDKPGKYRMWVRTKNLGDNWRSTTIEINGKSAGEFGDIFGFRQKKAGWGYSRTSVDLPVGEVTIKLISKNSKCRLMRIWFTDDIKSRPHDLEILKDVARTNPKKKGFVTDPGHLPSDFKIEIPRRPRGPKNGPQVLMFGGGRPWMSNGLANKLCDAGINLYLVNGFYLGGLSGASIKQTPQQKNEPTPHNYVPYEFKQLSRYRVVFFSAISEKNQAKLLADGRADKLREYVKNGGTLMLTVNTPQIIADLCPVELEDYESGEGFRLFATRPAGENFSSLPEKWGIVDPFRLGKAKENATVLSQIITEDGAPAAVYAAIWNYGKGKVLFLNNDYNRRQTVTQFFNWAYSRYLVAALLKTVGELQIDLARTLPPTPPQIKAKNLSEAKAEISLPQMTLEREDAQVAVKNGTIHFSNGYIVTVKNDAVDITFPGQKTPYITNKKFPEIGFPVSSDKVNDFATSEATNVKTRYRQSPDKLNVAKIIGGDKLVIVLKGEKGTEVEWEFITGKANVDGRIFSGIGEKIRVLKMVEPLLNQIRLTSNVDVDNQRLRRFACYAGPRGYAEYDLTGKQAFDTGNWGFFANGQPFTWVEGGKCVLAGFVDRAFPVNVRYAMKKDDTLLDYEVKMPFGRVKVPQETAIFWHMAADKNTNTDNDWMAMYQFQRHMLRKKAGFPEIPATPVATYSNTCNATDRDASLRAAKEFGFDVVMVPMCPTALDAYDKPGVLNALRRIKGYGLKAYPWHPCCHTPGDVPLVYNHPEWFIHDETGKLAGYFGGHYRTADMNNPDFMKYYMNMVDGMIDAGAVTAWYDMGGAASGTYNFATPESPVGFWAQQKIYKHWYDRGGFIITEGMNPLVIDGYLFFAAETKAARRYNEPVIGREFPFIGANSAGSSWWYMDFFRTSMYGWFHDIVIDSWPSKFESNPGQLKELQKIKNYMPTIKTALSFGMPFIRQEIFGTTWISERGGAVFCFDGVQNLSVKLPAGFVPESITGKDGVIKSLGGEMPKQIEAGSIILFRKK